MQGSVYLPTGGEMCAVKRRILNELLLTLWALKKPFILVGDWNCDAQLLEEVGFLRAAMARAFVPEGYTCIQQTVRGIMSKSSIDYAVCSYHFGLAPRVALFEPGKTAPHMATELTLPMNLPVPLLPMRVLPLRWPGGVPNGPWRETAPSTVMAGLPAPQEGEIDAAMKDWYHAYDR